jgi:hypothetical protein
MAAPSGSRGGMSPGPGGGSSNVGMAPSLGSGLAGGLGRAALDAVGGVNGMSWGGYHDAARAAQQGKTVAQVAADKAAMMRAQRLANQIEAQHALRAAIQAADFSTAQGLMTGQPVGPSAFSTKSAIPGYASITPAMQMAMDVQAKEEPTGLMGLLGGMFGMKHETVPTLSSGPEDSPEGAARAGMNAVAPLAKAKLMDAFAPSIVGNPAAMNTVAAVSAALPGIGPGMLGSTFGTIQSYGRQRSPAEIDAANAAIGRSLGGENRSIASSEGQKQPGPQPVEQMPRYETPGWMRYNPGVLNFGAYMPPTPWNQWNSFFA